MKIYRVLVDILCEIAPKACKDFVTCENNNKILHANMLKPLYSTLKVLILYYQKFISDITKVECELNLHDLCIAIKIINTK